MKNLRKSLLSGLMLSALAFTSCSDDDTTDVAPVVEPAAAAVEVILSEVQYQTADLVEIQNVGTGNVDLSDFFLCLGPGTYQRVGSLTVQSGSVTDLGPDEYLVVSYSMPDDSAGLGLYENNDGFGDPSNIADFVQWGASGSVREGVAVQAGVWTAGEFVPTLSNVDNSIVFDGEGNGAADWAETSTPSLGLSLIHI